MREENNINIISKQQILERKTTGNMVVFHFLIAGKWWKFVPTKKAGAYNGSQIYLLYIAYYKNAYQNKRQKTKCSIYVQC